MVSGRGRMSRVKRWAFNIAAGVSLVLLRGVRRVVGAQPLGRGLLRVEARICYGFLLDVCGARGHAHSPRRSRFMDATIFPLLPPIVRTLSNYDRAQRFAWRSASISLGMLRSKAR